MPRDPIHNPRNLWTPEQRIFLLLCKRLHSLTWSDIERIFNRAFRSDLVARGFREDQSMSERTLTAQWREMLVYKRREYKAVYETNLSDLAKQFHEINNKLVTIAQATGVEIVPRDTNDTATVERFTARRVQFAMAQTLKRAAPEESESDSPSFDPGTTPPASPRVTWYHLPTPPVTPSRPTVGVSVCSIGTEKRTEEILITGIIPDHNGLPCLLFRAYNHRSQGVNQASGFRAGGYGQDGDKSIKTLDGYSETFLAQAEGHFSRRSSPSPFISVTQSLIYAFQKAYELSTQTGGAVHIAVIDGRQAAHHNRLYYAAPICAKLKELRRVSFRYKGRYEYLAWHAISQTAVIGIFELSALQNLAITQPPVSDLFRLHAFNGKRRTTAIWNSFSPLPIDQDFGTAVAYFAMLITPSANIHNPFVEDLANVIIQSFRVPIRGITCHILMDTIEQGFCNATRKTLKCVSIPEPSLTPPCAVLEEIQIKSEFSDESATEDDCDVPMAEFPRALWFYSPYE